MRIRGLGCRSIVTVIELADGRSIGAATEFPHPDHPLVRRQPDFRYGILVER